MDQWHGRHLVTSPTPETLSGVRSMDRKVPDVFDVFGIGKFYSFNLMDERLIKLIFRGALYSQYPQGWNCFARSSGQERGHPVCLVRQTGQVIWINNKHTFVFVDNQTCVLCYYRQNAKWREGRSQCERPRTYDKFYQKTPGNFQALVSGSFVWPVFSFITLGPLLQVKGWPYKSRIRVVLVNLLLCAIKS